MECKLVITEVQPFISIRWKKVNTYFSILIQFLNYN